MAEVKILIEGHLENDISDQTAFTTISLVKDGNIRMIVDPGALPSQQMLVDKLKEQGLTTTDINVVFLTHSHYDHYANAALFSKAKVLEYWGLWEGVAFKDWPENFSKNIRIIKTPGHDYSSLTALVKTSQGIIAICGDVFWREDYPADDPYASDKEKLAVSRKLVTELADYIVPGHGDIYKVRKM